MSNVLSEEKKQQVIALGRLGWSLRRMNGKPAFVGKPISAYLKEAGVACGRRAAGRYPAKPANEVTTDPEAAKPASRADEVTPDSGAESAPKRRQNQNHHPVASPRRVPASPPGSHRIGTLKGPQRQGHLAGLGRWQQLRRWLSERQAFRPPSAWEAVAGSLHGDRDRARRRLW